MKGELEENGITFKILLKGSDGNTYECNASWLLEKLGLLKTLVWNEEAITGALKLELRLYELIRVMHKHEIEEDIITFLRVNQPVGTRLLNRWLNAWKNDDVSGLYEKTFLKMVKRKQITYERRGRGKDRLWRLTTS